MADNSFRHHLTAAARDIAVLGSVAGALLAASIALTRPYWEPFANLPEDVARIQQQVVTIQTRLTEGLSPEIVSFKQSISVQDTVKQGGTLAILYFLKRHASCQTEVRPLFYDIKQNFSISAEPFLAQRAPVTTQYILFQVRVPIPEDIPLGEYVYVAELVPIDCGVYGPMRALPSQTFTVTEREER